MKIKECKFHHFIIDKHSSRHGIFLHFSNEIGQIAHAEISPLPGYSLESIDEAFRQLDQIKSFLLHTEWFQEDIHPTLLGLSLYPSVFFGLESVLTELCDPRIHIPCKKYALILGTIEEMIKRAEEAYIEGFRTAKVKVGHLNIEQTTELVLSLNNRFHLRLDFNRQWSLSKTLKFCAQFPVNHFDYLEEPVDTWEDLYEFPYFFALDETLRSQPIGEFLSLENFTTCVIKPTLHYPFDSLLKTKKQIVLSSSFESPLGIRQIEKLAARLDLLETEHGLDTLRYFEDTYDDSLSDQFLASAHT